MILADIELDNIRAVETYLSKNYRWEINLPKLTKIAGMNERKLRQGFKQLYSKTIRDYHVGLKMDAAKRLLLDESKSIQEVAEQVGYKSSSTFIRAFEKMFGVNPSLWRKIQKKSEQVNSGRFRSIFEL